MPHALRGSIHWYDLGHRVGHELSGHRPALIISNTELNRNLTLAVAIPTSRTAPPESQHDNHTPIEDTSSWASVRQIKSVEQGRLGERIGAATPEELDWATEVLAARLAFSVVPPRTIRTGSGTAEIRPGTIWEMELQDPDGTPRPTTLLVLDYNRGNGMAIPLEVELQRAENSPVRVPIEIRGTAGSASALIHRVRSLDMAARNGAGTGEVELDSLAMVARAFLAVISR